jgi:hypothetical protein
MKDTLVVDNINELSDLSRKLNEKSDALNAAISSVNKKLVSLNFGVEVWLEESPIECGDFDTADSEIENGQTDLTTDATLLGYCYVEDAWQLAVKYVTLHTRKDKLGRAYNEVTDSLQPRPLLKASRQLRFKSASEIPQLLDRIKDEATLLLEGIEKAEKAASKL